ncbi:MAG: acyl-ACP--UDP-N-acetylglucosamine O-acyltransferase [Phycisphaerales bacterium]
MSHIHPTAVVDPSARIGRGVRVGPWCVVGRDAEVGDDSELVSNVVLGPWTVLGRENVIHPFAVVGGDPQDRKFQGEMTRLEVGDRNQIREHVSIHRGTGLGGGITRIGSDNLIMGVVHIAHDCLIGNGTIIANNAMLAGHVKVDDYANIGGGAGLHHFATVGTLAFVGAMSRCSIDIPPFMIVEGVPAKVRGHNHVAMRRRGWPEAEVEAIREAYKRLFRERGGQFLDKISQLRSDFPESRALAILCDTLLLIDKGVHGRARESSRSDDKWSSPPPQGDGGASGEAS